MEFLGEGEVNNKKILCGGGGGWIFSETAHCISRNVADARRENQVMNKMSPKICKGNITQGN